MDIGGLIKWKVDVLGDDALCLNGIVMATVYSGDDGFYVELDTEDDSDWTIGPIAALSVAKAVAIGRVITWFSETLEKAGGS